MPFALTNDPSQSEISEAINYLLANFGPNLSADPNNGQISGPSGDIIGYLYKYIAVKYADSFDGSVNFSDSPTNRLYYGLRNSNDSTESTNYADYLWYKVAGGGFGTTKFLYYIVTGGRSIQFQIATSTPNPGWVLDTGASIDLDVTTSAKAVANFVIIRIPNNSGPPTDAECLAAIGRTPISGDLCTINYNNGIYSITYKYTTGWAVFQKYITGDLIVANSIVASNIAANTITAGQIAANTITAGQIAANTITAGQIAANTITAGQIAANTITSAQIAANSITANSIDSRNLTIKDGSGNIIFGSGASVNASSYLVPSGGWLNSNISISGGAITGIGSGDGTAVANSAISINSNGTLSGAGSGQVNLGGLGAGAFAYLNAITSANVTTYISGAAIGTAQIGVLTAGNIGANTIDASKIAANTITAGQIAANTITADRMSVTNLSAITANLGTITAGSISGTSLSVGSSPAVSGTSMSGAGAVINTNGTFALGNGSTNISYNGSQMSLNGNVVATGNVNSNAITNVVYASAGGIIDIRTSGTTWTNILSISFTTTGGPLLITTNGNQVIGFDSTSNVPVSPVFRLVRDSTILVYKSLPLGGGVTAQCDASISYAEIPSSGTYTYYLQGLSTSSTFDPGSPPGVQISFISVTELKR